MNSQGTTVKTYKLVPTTEYQVNGKKAKIEDLEAGMKVGVTPAMDVSVAGRVVAGPTPRQPNPTSPDGYQPLAVGFNGWPPV